MRRLVLIAAALAACNSDVDQPWQLDHDRIIAVRADPPSLAVGDPSSTLTMLDGFKGGSPQEKKPDLAQVVSPMSLASLVHIQSDGNWVIDAPTDAQLAAARAELHLAATDPVPLRIGVANAWPTPVVSPMGNGFAATKVVLLGVAGTNPTLEGLTINGTDPGDGDLVVSATGKTPLFVQADDSVNIVNWLTSAGTMHDFDLHSAYITFEKDDMTEGELAVVLRDGHGGVVWKIWSIKAQ